MNTLKQKQLDFLSNLQKNFEGGAVQPAELAKVVKAMVNVFKDYRTDLDNKFVNTIESIKSDLEKSVSMLENKAKISNDHNSESMKTEMRGLIKDINSQLSSLNKEIKGIKDLIPKEVDLTEIWKKFDSIVIPSADDIEDKIEKNLPKFGEVFRDALELLQGDERLDVSAIKGLEELLKALESRISTVKGSGGVSNMRIAQAFKYILKREEPVGAINSSNTEYTVSQPIFAVLSFSINGEIIAQLPNYTISGNKIIFSSALPSAYSGKDFEISYI